MYPKYSLFNFIVNPKSGSNLDVSGIRRLCKYLGRQRYEVRLDLTRSLTHAGELAHDAMAQGAAVVVVAGGDGTVRQVAEAMTGSHVPILIIPWGTENLLASQLGLDGLVETNKKTLENGRIRPVDLGQANKRCFTAVVGVGFDAEVVSRVHGRRAGHITPASYLWPLLRTFCEHSFPHLHVVGDGQVLCDEPALVFVSNISRYAIGLGISREADCSDGKLDLCIYKCGNRLRLLDHAAKTVLKKTDKSPLVLRQRCKEIVINSENKKVYSQLDGDPGPVLPIHIKVIPAATNLLTPPPPDKYSYCPPVRWYHLRRWLLR